MKRILLVEDNVSKQERIKLLVEKSFSAQVTPVSTINAACPHVERLVWDAVILDMTFQISVGMASDVGKQGLAGIELLQYMCSKEIIVPVIVATQHHVFAEPGLLTLNSTQELDALLLESFPELYRGIVSVDLASEEWQATLVTKLSQILNA